MTTLLTPAQWAQQEFAFARLGDKRLTQRLVRLGPGLAQNPGGTLPQAFPEMKDLKAAYRFFSQPKVGPHQIQSPHWEQTRAACRQPGEYLLIEDTSELDYSAHPGCEELGPIGKGRGRGLLLHSTLAVRVEGWDLTHRPEGMVLGLMDQQCWKRSGPPKRGRETWKQRLQRPCESQRWGAVLEFIEPPPAHSQWIFIADREPIFTSRSNAASGAPWILSSAPTGTGGWPTRRVISRRRWRSCQGGERWKWNCVRAPGRRRARRGCKCAAARCVSAGRNGPPETSRT